MLAQEQMGIWKLKKKVTEDKGQVEQCDFLTQVGEFARDMGVLALLPLQVSPAMHT